MKRMFFTLILALIISISYSPTCMASNEYRVSLENEDIKITSPASSGISCSGRISISGTTTLDTVWFCLRNPDRELSGFKALVIDGSFRVDVNLCYGPGEYTIWAGSDPRSFDGSIRFFVVNRELQDKRYVSASQLVDSDNPKVIRLASSLAPVSLDDMQKLRNVHAWVTNNISYDVDHVNKGPSDLLPASSILESGKGICGDYANLMAALCRAVGLPVKVIHGEATVPGGFKGYHAWNEVLINDNWVAVDACWDSGYVKNNTFVPAPSSKYLAAKMDETHMKAKAMLY